MMPQVGDRSFVTRKDIPGNWTVGGHKIS
jgi:hypothetical protein